MTSVLDKITDMQKRTTGIDIIERENLTNA